MATITVNSGTIENYKHDDETLIMRIYLAHNFRNSDDVQIMAGRMASPNWYKEIDCTVEDEEVTFDSFTIDSTADAIFNPRNTYYVFGLFTADGKLRGIPFHGIRVPASPSPTTMAALQEYSQGPTPPPQGTAYYSQEEIDLLLTGKVSMTGNETVAGVKTFSSSPIIPGPTTDLQAATKKYVDDNAAPVSDGDKGDITVTGSGSTWTIDNAAVTFAKIQSIQGGRIVARENSSSGSVAGLNLTEVLDFIGSVAQGDILFRGASGWVRLGTGSAGQFLRSGGAGQNLTWASFPTPVPSPIGIACSDETTPLEAADAVATFRMPFADELLEVRATLTNPSSSGDIEIDVRKNGTTIFSTPLTIDESSYTSGEAAVPAVINVDAFADDDEFTIDINEEGTNATGLKLWFIFK